MAANVVWSVVAKAGATNVDIFYVCWKRSKSFSSSHAGIQYVRTLYELVAILVVVILAIMFHICAKKVKSLFRRLSSIMFCLLQQLQLA